MIDTDKYKGHTPAKKWKVNEYCEESLGIFYLEGTTNPNRVYEGCLHCGSQRDGLTQQVFDGRMSEEEMVKLCERDNANQNLMQDAPLILEAYEEKCKEVKRLREGIKQANQLRECLWWCYDNKRWGWDIDEQMWEVIGRLLGADTDHNDNEWGEEE